MREEDFPRLLSGRLVTRDDLETVRRIIAQNPTVSRLQISRAVCQAWGWFKPDGGLKEMRARGGYFYNCTKPDRLQRLVASDVPLCPIYHDVCLYATRKEVQDLTLDPFFKPGLEKAWIK